MPILCGLNWRHLWVLFLVLEKPYHERQLRCRTAFKLRLSYAIKEGNATSILCTNQQWQCNVKLQSHQQNSSDWIIITIITLSCPCPTQWHPTPRPGQEKWRSGAKRKGKGVYWDGALRLISGPVWGRRPPRQWHGCEVLPEVMGTRQSSPCPQGHRSPLDLFYPQTAHLSGRRSDQPCSVERES